MLEGAMHEPANSERFLKIILKQADRLNSIIEDLLLLARLEQDTEKKDMCLETVKLGTVLKASIDDCAIRAQEKSILLELQCPAELELKINPHLIEQAVVKPHR